jgi:peptidoglycan/LPS O-acetylase OafA/YrhL
MADPSRAAHPNRLLSVDILRALAALAVVVHHVPFSAAGVPEPFRTALSLPTRLGQLGMPLFLVLSGFCIHLSVARGMARGNGIRADWGGFWRRRFWRLYPPYLAAAVFALCVYAAAGPGAYPAYERIVWLPGDALAHLLMVHNLFADYCFGLGNGPFWTLGLEEQLYALYAVYLLARRRMPSGRVVGLALVVSLAWQCGWRWAAGMDDGAPQPTLGPAPLALGRWLKWPFGLWLSWVLGARAAEAYAGAAPLAAWCYRRRTAALLALAGLVTSHPALEFVARRLPEWEPFLRPLAGGSDLAFAAAGFVVLNRWVRAESAGGFRGPVAAGLAAVGAMSYSLYLTHLPLVRLLSPHVFAGESLAAWLLRLAVFVPACLAVAAAFFWLVERHFLTARRPAAASGRAGGADGQRVGRRVRPAVGDREVDVRDPEAAGQLAGGPA